MSIIQISKIQQRSGNIVDLPQLDEAEFGWASDTKQLFIGKTTPNENVEVLTSYSQINFDQINGTVGNINITPTTAADGQVLTYDGENWVNRGGSAGGIINLGQVSNVKISGGAIGYVLETDGLGNLSWTPKSSIISFIQNVTTDDPAIVTTTQDNFLTNGLRITITNAQGMTELNGNTYFVNVLSSNTFALYTDSGLSVPVDATGFTDYSFTTATATTASTNVITVGDSSVLSLNQAVEFLGDLGNSLLENNIPYYIKSIPDGSTITVSETLLPNGTAGDTKVLVTETLIGANVYAPSGRVIATVSGSGSTTAAQGSQGSIQFYDSGLLQGGADLVWDVSSSPKTLTATGNINTGNINATGVATATRLISNIATGTAPLTVTSTTRVANLNVDRANVSDFGVVTNRNTGTFFPVFVDGSSNANRSLSANANLSFNAATGELSATSLAGNLTTAAQPNITSTGTLTGLTVSGNISIADRIIHTGDTDTAIRFPAADTFTVETAGSERLRVTSTGDLGIGTSSPTNALTVVRASSTAAIDITSGANTFQIYQTTTGSSALVNYTSGGNITVSQAGAGFINFGTNGSERLRIDSSGNVGIGTSSPASLLHVEGGSVRTSVGYIVSGAGELKTSLAGSGIALNTAGANGIAFETGGTPAERMRITSAGNVGIGNTAPTHTLSVTGTAAISTSLQVANITTGANTTAGTITGNWTLTAGSRLEATYADLAEYYEADDVYTPGTVLMFGGDKEVTIAEDGTNRVAGVVSTKPAYVMNSSCPGLLTAIALQGRVPCKVRGKIRKGDMLVSGENGYARPEQSPSIGTVIGKALENFDNGEGVIEVAVGRL